MADIKSLIGELQSEARKERDMFSGSEKREFFIEAVGASSLSDLLDKYDPKTHDQKWVKEYQKDNPDIDKLMQEGRAVDFMSSGRMGIIRHYGYDEKIEGELFDHVIGRARMNWNLNILDQVKLFTELDYAKKQ